MARNRKATVAEKKARAKRMKALKQSLHKSELVCPKCGHFIEQSRTAHRKDVCEKYQDLLKDWAVAEVKRIEQSYHELRLRLGFTRSTEVKELGDLIAESHSSSQEETHALLAIKQVVKEFGVWDASDAIHTTSAFTYEELSFIESSTDVE